MFLHLYNKYKLVGQGKNPFAKGGGWFIGNFTVNHDLVLSFLSLLVWKLTFILNNHFTF